MEDAHPSTYIYITQAADDTREIPTPVLHLPVVTCKCIEIQRATKRQRITNLIAPFPSDKTFFFFIIFFIEKLTFLCLSSSQFFLIGTSIFISARRKPFQLFCKTMRFPCFASTILNQLTMKVSCELIDEISLIVILINYSRHSKRNTLIFVSNKNSNSFA